MTTPLSVMLAEPKASDPKLERESNNEKDRMLSRLVKWRDESEEALRPGFVKAERDWDYYDNKQLTQEEIDKLRERGQPPISINLIRRKIDFLRGMEIKQRTDPKAWPRTPADSDSAEVATDSLRYVFDACHYNQSVRKWVWKDLLVVGWGGAQLRLKPGRGDRITQAFQMEPNPKLVWKRTPWNRMLWDRHSSEHDFADARYKGLVLWLDEDQAAGLYRDNPDAEDIIAATIDASGRMGAYGDTPKNSWVDSRKRVCVVQMWWKDADQAFWAEFTQGGILKGGLSPFRNEDEEPCDNLVWQSCYVDRDNNRHGVVRDMIDPQDEINKRRSKSLHLLTMRQVRADEGAVQDVEKARKQVSRPDGWITTTPGLEFEILQNQDLAAGQMQLLQHATAELEKMGPNEALQGQGSATSGRDRQAQQQGGMIELGPTLDDMMWVDLRAYTLSWAAVQDHWTAPQFIRVTDNPDAPKFVGLNEPMMASPDMPVIDQNGAVAMQNRPAELNVDIIIQPAPDTVAIEQEVFDKFMELMPVFMQMPPHLQEFSVQISSLPPSRKRQLIDLLKQGQQKPNPMQEKMAMLEVAEKEAGVTDKQASAQLKQANAAKIGKEIATPEQGPAPMTPLDQAKVVHTHAQAQHTRAQTMALMREAMAGQAPEPLDAMDMADIRHKNAQTFKTTVDAAKVVHEIENPPPAPRPAAGA